jgi:hypothetical protein
VSGQVRFSGEGASSVPLDVRVEGRGFFDHYFGLSPLSECISRVMYGRVILANRALVFEVMQEEGSSAMTQGELLQIDGGRERSIDAGEMKIDSRSTPMRVDAPPRVTFAGHLDLTNPRVIDANAVSAQVLYDATAGDERTTALCEILYPSRVGKLIQGMRIKRWFDRVNGAR